MTGKIKIPMLRKNPCNNCGYEVEPANNADYWDVAYRALNQRLNPEEELIKYLSVFQTIRAGRTRHLMPVDGCEGKPNLLSMINEGLITYDSGRWLEKENYVSLTDEEKYNAKKAYEFIQRLEK